MELSSGKIKIVLIFSQKAFLIFQETDLVIKNFIYFRKELPRQKILKNALKKVLIYSNIF